jgi:hypothetical protein
MQYNTVQYSTIQINAMQCGSVQLNAILSNFQSSAIYYNIYNESAVQLDTLQYYTTHYNALHWTIPVRPGNVRLTERGVWVWAGAVGQVLMSHFPQRPSTRRPALSTSTAHQGNSDPSIVHSLQHVQ